MSPEPTPRRRGPRPHFFLLAALALPGLVVALGATPPSPVELLDPPPYGEEISRARRDRIAGRSVGPERLVAYLDAGVQASDASSGKPGLLLARGSPWLWDGVDVEREGPQGTVAFDPSEVRIEVVGLAANRRYRLGFSWWDFDGNGRRQSVHARAGAGRRAKDVVLVVETPLPRPPEGLRAPAELSCPLPAELCAGGRITVTFRREGLSNAVVGEAWLWEQDPAAEAASARSRSEKSRVLIVTGQDYPGHHWKETAPVVAELLARDDRLEPTIREDPAALATEALDRYDVVVLHFMNWERPDPGPAAREALREYARAGGGVLLIHFACGAFQAWPRFVEIAGRVWDPDRRPHDPRGPFRVTVAPLDHPVSRGLPSFEEDDELYTCLRGDRPVDVIATATSKVDHRVYPMAFSFRLEKGRVFHTVLGHDVKAMRMPGFGALLRRGCAWAAGLAPRDVPLPAASRE